MMNLLERQNVLSRALEAAPTAKDLFLQAWLDDQATELARSAVSFFNLKKTGTGELTMAVFGSGVLITHRDRTMVVTALSVASECAQRDCFMQTSMGAVAVSDQTFCLDRGQLIAASEVDKRVRDSAVLPERTERIEASGNSIVTSTLLCLGYPGTRNAFRKSRRPGSFELKALLAPYVMGNVVRTTVQHPLFLQWQDVVEIKGHGRSEADVGLDPKGMIGGPVYDVVIDDDNVSPARLRGLMVDARSKEELVVVHPAGALPEFLSYVQSRQAR